MTAPVGLWIDWDKTGFGSSVSGDCTTYVMNARYSRGGSPEITGAAQVGSATFILKNPNGLFTPTNTSSPLYGLLTDGVRVWFGVNEDGTVNQKGATVRGRFAGYITEITPIPEGGAGTATPTVEIICEDALGWYGRKYVALGDDCSGNIVPPIACPPTLRQSAVQSGLIPGSSHPIVLGSSVAAGNLIVLAWGGVTTPNGSPHTAGFTQLLTEVDNWSGTMPSSIWYKIAAGTEGASFYIDTVASTSYIYAAEFAGCSGAALTLDASSRVSGTASLGPIAGSVTPTAGVRLLLALMPTGNGNTPAVSDLGGLTSGWTSLGTANTGGIGFAGHCGSLDSYRQQAILAYQIGPYTATAQAVGATFCPGYNYTALDASWSVLMASFK